LLDGISVDPVNLGDGFVTHGSVAQLYSHCGLDAASVADKIMEVVRREN
jgi:deoxyxylulose-5-phosphate synthase